MDQQPTFPNPRNSGISDDIELIDLVSDEDTDGYSSCTSISTPSSSAPSSPRQAPTTLGEAMGSLRDTLYELHERFDQVDDFVNQVRQQPGPSGVGTDRRHLMEPALKKVKMDELTAQESNRGGANNSTAASTTGLKLKCFERRCYLKFESELTLNKHTEAAHFYKMTDIGRLQCCVNECGETFLCPTMFWEHKDAEHSAYGIKDD